MIKGRQCLFVIYEYFKTNEKLGSLYNFKALTSVALQGDNLEGFVSTWEMVLSGMDKVPEQQV